MTIDLILGTAGHIDHGKTSLIRALTGVDTDRLPEEKKRGITIELGFAELQVGPYQFGIVDVPGHERFVRNMLAGATGMDVAMLVVAADDSVKQQTREHLDILRMLNLVAGLVVITKTDLVDADWLELVEDEIRELTRGTFLEGAPIVRTSAKSGVGIDEVKDQLQAAADRAQQRSGKPGPNAPFRLAIDRTFPVEGHGTVVTGSVSSGTIRVGDEACLQPGGQTVRIRGLHNHDRAVDQVHRGQRAAINLGGVRHDEIQRGQELASPGHLQASRLLTVWLDVLPSASRPLKHRSRLRLHVGAAELLCNVVLLDAPALEPGQGGPAQLFLAAPAATTWNQPLVIRSESPVTTIGGGQVLDPQATKLRKVTPEDLTMIRQLRAEDPVDRASAALYLAGLRGWSPDELPRTAGITDVATVYKQLRERQQLRELPISPTRTFRLHQRIFEQLSDRVEAALKRLHEEFPLRTAMDRWQLANGFRYLDNESLLNAVVESMRAGGRVRSGPQGVSLVGHGPKLSQGERKLLVQLIDQYRQAGFQAPTVKQIQQKTQRNQDSVPALVSLAAANGELIQINDEYYLHAEVEQSTRDQLAAELVDSAGLTLSQIREILNTTRKYAVPYCEYLDRAGFTRRQGDLRVLATAKEA